MNDRISAVVKMDIGTGEKLALIAVMVAPQDARVTIKYVAETAGVAYTSAHRWMTELRKRGLVVRHGRGAWATYTMGEV